MNTFFLSCDWGTSSFRLRLVDSRSGSTIHQLAAQQGTALTYQQWKETGLEENRRLNFYLDVLKQYIEKILRGIEIDTANLSVVVSGMASSSIGMLELPYTQMPFSVTGDDLHVKDIPPTKSFPYRIILISGAKTSEDVMRGEEVQLVGCSDGLKTGRQAFIFPGTHSKHIITEQGRAISFETFMTGEFFALLSKNSILADSVTAGADINDPGNRKAFEQGVRDSSKQNLLHNSFVVRTNQLFEKYSKSANFFYLSGLLIGTELNQLANKQASNITIVGDSHLQQNYKLALQLLFPGMEIYSKDGGEAIIKGQTIIYKRIQQEGDS